jgi:uncharacterized protein (TIGR03435 family)
MKFAWIGALLLLSFAGSPVRAQSKGLSFEVASVKLNPNPSRTPVHFGRDNVNLISVDLRVVLMLAYGVRDFQIQGPDWLRDLNGAHRFNVEAKAPHPVPEDRLGLMLRTLLADRFHLTLHHEQREMAVIAMRPARSGVKVIPTVGGVPPDTQWTGFPGVLFTDYKFINAPMEALATAVGACTGNMLPPVVDQTGLKGRFDFAPPPRLPPQPPDAPAMTDEDRLAGCDLNAQRAVGMTLKRAKAFVDILVIDHADKVPTED